jgi:hypothetical protein
MTKRNQEYTQADLDNRSRQLNAENDAHWQSRGFDERPDDWQKRSDSAEQERSSNKKE